MKPVIDANDHQLSVGIGTSGMFAGIFGLIHVVVSLIMIKKRLFFFFIITRAVKISDGKEVSVL